MLRWLRRIIFGLFALIGLFAVAMVALVAIIGWSLVGHVERSLPGNIVLQLDLTQPIAEGGREDRIVALLSGERLTLRQLEEALERGSQDPRVKGLVARVGGAPLPLATAQEIREAIAAFRTHHKFTLAFGEDYGAPGRSAADYDLATGFEEIWLQPSGAVGLTGIAAETPFLRGTFDKLGIVPRFDKRDEYKTAVNELTDTRYDAAFKESMQSIVDSLYGQLVHGIADGRGLSPDAVRGLIDQGPFLAADALKAKLVDRLGYYDELESVARLRAGSGAQMVGLRRYYRATGAESHDGRVIATITARGPILSGKGDPGGPFSSARVGADTIAEAFHQARTSADVAAIVFRIDSPGGSYTAADTIWRAVAAARRAGKPVIVSMGSVAASGGYFIAAPATKIVAEPATLTGSIGVFSGKLVLQGLFDKLGVSFDRVQDGANAGMWSATHDFSQAAWGKLEGMLDAVYTDFTGKVSQGRGILMDRIPSVAKGRVWTGEQAVKLGLVDSLGGFRTALNLARIAAGIPAGQPIQLREYPQPTTEYQRILDRLISQATGVSVAAALPETRAIELATALGMQVSVLRPLIDELPALTAPGDAFLLMPPVAIQ